MAGADRAVFYFINGWPEGLAPIFVFFSEATKWGWVRIVLGLVVLVLIAYRPTRKATLLALLAWPLANGITEALKTAIPMLRPVNELPDVALRVGKLTTYGTASSHSANMAAIAFVFTRLHGWRGSPWIIVALLTGLSRVYVGVHYPSQVLFGWLMGIVCGLIVVETWEAYARLRTRKRG
ncbi:MAG TPA: phosphatase PAP2 family protein [Fimbriimonadaceae bacterium]|nr:phosphatase PAP2 family protein [Fimbriimonadaceae bacterium]